MYKKYPLMQKPFKLPNGVLLKNPIESTPSGVHFIQGPEPYPNEAVIDNYANRARNGAAIIAVSGPSAFWSATPGHFRRWDIKDAHNFHYISQLTEAIHGYGSIALARFDIDPFIGKDYDVSTGIATPWVVGDGSAPRYDCVQAPVELMENVLDDYVEYVASLKEDMGFDGIWLHMAYRHMFLGRLFSPLTNKRTDKYGGSLENRCRYHLELTRRVKERCGKRFIIEGSISGHDPVDGGVTLEDMAAFAKMAEGHFDILQVKGPTIDECHPTQFHTETPWLYMAESIKATKPNVAILSVGGFLKPELVDNALCSGKADMIGMARSWISNFDYGELVREGRQEDIIPCLKCNKCHRSSNMDAWTSVCSVNPLFGLEHKLGRIVSPPTGRKNIAVIGGGPGGMKAALTAAGRGHRVTLYEKTDRLGGLLDITKDVPFKWTLQEFKQYLITQVEKSPIKVILSAEPCPDELERENYDVVIAATGAVPALPPIPGVDCENVITAVDAYRSLNTLAHELVIIGGGELGVETGIYLSRLGHKVTVLEMQPLPASDSAPVHYFKMLRDEWESCESLKIIVNARASRITEDSVYYMDKDGAEQSIPAQGVIIATGMRPLEDEALRYFGAGGQFVMVGDCQQVGNVQKVMRSAFIAAAQL